MLLYLNTGVLVADSKDHFDTQHLCFDITEKGQMLVPDWYNRIWDYTKKYRDNSVFQWK